MVSNNPPSPPLEKGGDDQFLLWKRGIKGDLKTKREFQN